MYIVAADQTGVVWDGPAADVTHDTDFTLAKHTVTLHFSGFQSALSGIEHFLWAVGTQPRFDDVKPFSAHGIITDVTESRCRSHLFQCLSI